ncbi:Vacuolar sorting protein 39/Transforming growth factor beta receptor-associated domain 2 [Trinorchestia longiramus]|nr:Vacuolar sorting protein 39/Transforming growth factor beta receptor-associated domain 2 [Trinorchestia longiramus]
MTKLLLLILFEFLPYLLRRNFVLPYLKFLYTSESTYFKPYTTLHVFSLICLALNLTTAACLLAGRAVVLGRLGQHRQALQLYVSELHDLPAALSYCNAHCASSGSASQVYLFLLELLIQCDDVAALLNARPAWATVQLSNPEPSHFIPSNKPPDGIKTPPITEIDSKQQRQLSNNNNNRGSNDSSSSNNTSSLSNSINDSNYQSGANISSRNDGTSQRSKSAARDALRKRSVSPPHQRAAPDDASDNAGVDDRGYSPARARNKPVSPLTTADSKELPDSGHSSCHSLDSSSSLSSSKPPAEASATDPKFDILLNLLHTYSQNIRLKPAVQLLPDTLKVQELRSFLQSWVRQFASARHKMELQHGTAQAVVRQVTSDLCLVQSNKINLSSQNTCCICKKRLTRFSAFVCSPSGAVCHFSCRERVHSSWMQEVQQARQQQELKARTRAAVAAAVASSSPSGGH